MSINNFISIIFLFILFSNNSFAGNISQFNINPDIYSYNFDNYYKKISNISYIDNDQLVSLCLDTYSTILSTKKDIANKQELINQKYDHINNLNDKYITILSCLSAGFISISGLIIGIGAFLINRENNKLIKQKELEFTNWMHTFSDKSKEIIEMHTIKTNNMYTEKFKYFQQLKYFITLDVLVNTPPLPSPEIVFPLLTPLTSDPKIEYKHLFKKILSLYNYDDEIRSKIRNALIYIKDIST